MVRKKLFILFFVMVSQVYAQPNLRKLLLGVWYLDSIYQNCGKKDIQFYLKTIEFTGNGRILLGTGTYSYIIQGDSIVFDYYDNDVRKLVSITEDNLVIFEKTFGDWHGEFLGNQTMYYSRKKE